MELHGLQIKPRRMSATKIALIACIAVGILLATVIAIRPFATTHDPIAEAEQTYAPFPSIDASSLTPVQQRLLLVLKQEYALHPQNYDNNVMKYTEGNEESWCADFISWAMDQADSPYTNPNSQRWRIPGVLTLQDIYRNDGAYRAAGTYIPKLGDVAFYIGNQTPDGGSNEHVALVLKVEGNTVTTIGGNENNGGVQIRTDQIKAGEKGLVGFGISA